MPPAIKSLDVRPASLLFKALGDETRLRIVALRSHGELDAFRKAQLKALVGSFSKQEVLREDVERLVRTRGPAACR